jgi:quinol monooxygenase YgiN
VKFSVKESEVSKFQSLQKKHAEFATSQPGCKVFKLNHDFKNSSWLWLVEEWESMAVWKPYLQSAERAKNAESMMGLLAGPPQMAMYKIKN